MSIFWVPTVTVIRLLVPPNYSMNPREYIDISYYCIINIQVYLNNDQMEKDALYISKTKGLGENLTTPRDAADISPRKSSTEVVRRVLISYRSEKDWQNVRRRQW